MSPHAEIAKRWPRSAWDYRGLSRWVSFDESYWTAILAAGLLLSTVYLDVLLLWSPSARPLPVVGQLGGSPAGRILLVLLVLVNGWSLDRLLAARTPSGRREVPWVRMTRAALAAVPLLGLAVVPVWQRLTRSSPSWAFSPLPETALDLAGALPRSLGLAGFRTRMDARLRSWSQWFALQLTWLIGCQITPWFSGLSLLAENRKATVIVCGLLHVAGAGAGLAHAALRASLLQMSPGRTMAFRLLSLALLLPVPLSFLPLILWLPAAEDTREDRGVIQTLYRTRTARRHPVAAARRPREDEILGGTESRRRRAEAGKIILLFFESAAISRLAAAFGLFVLPVWATPAPLLLTLLVLPGVPGAVLLLTGAVGRIFDRFPRFAGMANHPSGISLTLSPPVFLLGTLSGALDASSQAAVLAALLLLIGFAGANAGLLAAIWSFVLGLFFGTPQHPYTGKIVALFSFLILAAFSPILARSPIFLILVTFGALSSLLAGPGIAARWLAPLRLRDLRDPRLPVPLRALLRAVALTAILPLGGLALPWWGQVRHQRGSELDSWAAHLREPAP